MEKLVNNLEVLKVFYEENYIWILGVGVILSLILAFAALIRSGRKRDRLAEQFQQSPFDGADNKIQPADTVAEEITNAPETTQEGLVSNVKMSESTDTDVKEAVENCVCNKGSEQLTDTEKIQPADLDCNEFIYDGEKIIANVKKGQVNQENQFSQHRVYEDNCTPTKLNFEMSKGDFPQDKELNKANIESDPLEEIKDKLYNIKIERANLVIDRVEDIGLFEKNIFGREMERTVTDEEPKEDLFQKLGERDLSPAELLRKAMEVNMKSKGATSDESENNSPKNPCNILGLEMNKKENSEGEVLLEKINLIKNGPPKRFGPDNMNINRAGRVFSEEELGRQIKD